MNRKKEMECQEEVCDGRISKESSISLIIGTTECKVVPSLLSCNECGRLHGTDGHPVFNRNGKRLEKLFLRV